MKINHVCTLQRKTKISFKNNQHVNILNSCPYHYAQFSCLRSVSLKHQAADRHWHLLVNSTHLTKKCLSVLFSVEFIWIKYSPLSLSHSLPHRVFPASEEDFLSEALPVHRGREDLFCIGLKIQTYQRSWLNWLFSQHNCARSYLKNKTCTDPMYIVASYNCFCKCASHTIMQGLQKYPFFTEVVVQYIKRLRFNFVKSQKVYFKYGGKK